VPQVGRFELSLSRTSRDPFVVHTGPDVNILQVPWATEDRAGQQETAVFKGFVSGGSLEIRRTVRVKVGIEPVLQVRLEFQLGSFS
jgi:hypothetical protein